jgi:hypothetical protein
LAHAELLYRQKRYSEALKSITELKFTKNDQLDEDLLLEIQHIVVQCQHATGTFNHSAGPHLAGLWKQALDVAPLAGEKYLRRAVFNAAWRDELWDLAQQLFLRLQKESPTNVRYHYAWIACAQLQASNLPADDKLGQSMKQLAFRSLKAIVDKTLAEKETARRVLDSRQLRLLVQVYSAQGQYAELRPIFDNDKIPPASLHSGEIELVREYLETLQALDEHEAVFNFAMERFERYRDSYQNKGVTVQEPNDDDARWADDWQLWKAMISSQEKSEKNRT